MTEERHPEPADRPAGERREPIILVLLVAIGLPFLMPQHFLLGPQWLVPAILAGLAITMVVVDPGRIDARSVQARYTQIGIVIVLIAGAGWATVALTKDLIYGSTAITNSGPALLRAGALVWVGLVISFAFLYWELDSGGPGQRAHHGREYPDLAFPQDVSSEVRRPGWRPVFVDYLYLGVTNGIAFSPTDVMPLAHWAKLAMAIQSIASLSVIGLVIARAVNIFK
jgi:uncharacterized membrane protein